MSHFRKPLNLLLHPLQFFLLIVRGQFHAILLHQSDNAVPVDEEDLGFFDLRFGHLAVTIQSLDADDFVERVVLADRIRLVLVFLHFFQKRGSVGNRSRAGRLP